VTIIDNPDSASGLLISRIRSLSREHLIDNTRPSIHICIGSHGCITEQFLLWLIAPCSWYRCVSVVLQLAHEAVKARIRDANAAIVLHQNVSWTDVPMLDTFPVQITDSHRNLGYLKQFIGIGAAPVMIEDISLFVVMDLEFRR